MFSNLQKQGMRSTADSMAEGRMKDGVGGKKDHKKQVKKKGILKNLMKNKSKSY